MTNLPPDVDPSDEIAVTWERDEEGVKISAVLGEASIDISASYEATQTMPWLVAALPNILEAAWASIEIDLDKEEAKA